MHSPLIVIVLLGVSFFCVAFFIKFNVQIIKTTSKILSSIGKYISKHLGTKISKTNVKYKQSSLVTPTTRRARFYFSTHDILINNNLHKDGVTVTSFIVIICFMSVVATTVVSILFEINWYISPLMALVFFVVIRNLFKSNGLNKSGQREECIMNAENAICSDITSGVENAIRHSVMNYDPLIRNSFYNFLDNKKRGMTMYNAMELLTEELGTFFRPFAQKCVMYDKEQDKTNAYIFKSIIDLNHFRHIVRAANEKIFKELNQSFVVCSGMTGLVFVFIFLTQPTITDFFSNTAFGKICLVLSFALVAFVVNRLTELKYKASNND
jgi:Flp pilus assembly protein TadB